MCNRQNLNHFEMKSRKPGQNGQPNNQNYNQNSTQGSMNSNRSFGQNTGMPTGSNGRPPLLPGRPGPGPGLGRPNNGPLLSSQPRLPQMSHPAMPFGAANAQQWPQLMQNGPRNNQMHGGGPSLNPMLRMPQGNNRSLINQPLLSAPNQGDLRTHLASGSSLGFALLFYLLNPREGIAQSWITNPYLVVSSLLFQLDCPVLVSMHLMSTPSLVPSKVSSTHQLINLATAFPEWIPLPEVTQAMTVSVGQAWTWAFRWAMPNLKRSSRRIRISLTTPSRAPFLTHLLVIWTSHCFLYSANLVALSFYPCFDNSLSLSYGIIITCYHLSIFEHSTLRCTVCYLAVALFHSLLSVSW